MRAHVHIGLHAIPMTIDNSRVTKATKNFETFNNIINKT